MGSVILSLKTMYDTDILYYMNLLHISDFKGVKMRDEFSNPRFKECGISNLEPHTEEGSHWTCWYKDGNERDYFDSFGEPPPIELERYLKTDKELKTDQPVIKRSAITVQHDLSKECGHINYSTP